MWGFEFRVRILEQLPARYLGRTLFRLGADVAETATIKTGLFIDNLECGMNRLSIGSSAYIGPQVFLDLAEPITIMAEAVLAPQVRILTHGDVGERMLAQYIPRQAGAVTLQKGCWIGAGATILPGITVGEGAIVGSGAVVTKDVPDYTVVAGIPAREIRRLK